MWHKNRDRCRTSTLKLSTLLSEVGITKKAGRLPQLHELYSKDRYKAEVQPIVHAKAKAMEIELGRKLNAKERLNNVKACTKEAFEACSAEYKQELQKRLEQTKDEAVAGRSGRTLTAATAERTPQQYQQSVPTFILHALRSD